jgi:hypothetical protein
LLIPKWLQTFMRRILLLCVLAALAVVATPATARAEVFAVGTTQPARFTNNSEHAKAIRPQQLCIRSAPQLRKASPPDSADPDQTTVLPVADSGFKVQRRSAHTNDVRQPPALLRERSHSPRAPPATA